MTNWSQFNNHSSDLQMRGRMVISDVVWVWNQVIVQHLPQAFCVLVVVCQTAWYFLPNQTVFSVIKSYTLAKIKDAKTFDFEILRMEYHNMLLPTNNAIHNIGFLMWLFFTIYIIGWHNGLVSNTVTSNQSRVVLGLIYRWGGMATLCVGFADPSCVCMCGYTGARQSFLCCLKWIMIHLT